MQIEATGKTVEIAIQNGLLECGMKREEVDVKIVDEGGLFKKAKVILTWGEKIEQPVEDILTEQNQEENDQQDNIQQEEIENTIEQEIKQEKKKRIVDTTRLENKCKEFLSGLVKFVDENASIDVERNKNELSFIIKGENVNKLIGYHGETIKALQILLSGLKTKGESVVRIYLDIDGYKMNRNQAIIDLANKVADQAVKIERNIHLDPMNAYDRRIVHTTLQEREDVTTESTGEGEKRHVVIKPIFK